MPLWRLPVAGVVLVRANCDLITSRFGWEVTRISTKCQLVEIAPL
jgi:hypothetical protein